MKKIMLLLTPMIIGLLCTMLVGVQTAKASVNYDLNHDGIVDMQDVGQVVAAFGSLPDDPRWDPASDLDGNGKVDMKDIGLIAAQFGQRGILEPEFVVPELPMGPILGIVGCLSALGIFGLIKQNKYNWHFPSR